MTGLIYFGRLRTYSHGLDSDSGTWFIDLRGSAGYEAKVGYRFSPCSGD